MPRYLSRIFRAIAVAIFGLGGGIGLMTFIALTLYSSQHIAIEVSLKTAFIFGLSFGVIIALVMFLTDLTMRLFVSHGQYNEIWELEQSRTIEVTGKLRDARRHCRAALLVVPHLKSISEDEDDRSMLAATGRSWRSPGEELSISITPSSENTWTVTCNSHCTQKNIAFDYGKNFENVETWLKKMRTTAS
ncbi:MAG: hypothetical protein K2W82_00505 [Candidatus Obscuribacterales bacterium]|nr:hypothetical protein [Candidatus Obscuribacterales bacterium]